MGTSIWNPSPQVRAGLPRLTVKKVFLGPTVWTASTEQMSSNQSLPGNFSWLGLSSLVLLASQGICRLLKNFQIPSNKYSGLNGQTMPMF